MAVEKDQNGYDAKETTETGSDLPNADGNISDEDLDAITDDGSDKPTGQDHSTDDYEASEPRDGVGAIQNSSEPSSGYAHIEDEKE